MNRILACLVLLSALGMSVQSAQEQNPPQLANPGRPCSLKQTTTKAIIKLINTDPAARDFYIQQFRAHKGLFLSYRQGVVDLVESLFKQYGQLFDINHLRAACGLPLIEDFAVHNVLRISLITFDKYDTMHIVELPNRMHGKEIVDIVKLLLFYGHAHALNTVYVHEIPNDDEEDDEEQDLFIVSYTPLHIAVLDNNAKMLELLLQYPQLQLNTLNSHGATALVDAIVQNYQDTTLLKTLLADSRIDPNQRILQNKTLLIVAAEQGAFYSAGILLADPRIDKSAVDDHGNTALMYAVRVRDTVIEDFFEHLTAQEINQQHQTTGNTAFMEAVLADNSDTVAAFLDDTSGKIDMNIKNNNGKTAFMLAVLNNQDDNSVRDMFFERNASNVYHNQLVDFNAQDNQGRTAVMLAVLERNLRLVKYLIAHEELDLSLVDNQGRTAVDLARQIGEGGIAGALTRTINQRERARLQALEANKENSPPRRMRLENQDDAGAAGE